MTETANPLMFYVKQLAEARKLSYRQIILGLLFSFGLMACSTFGLLYYVSVLTPFNFSIDAITRYTLYMLYGLFAVSLLALIICWITYKWPHTIMPLLKVHSFLKRGIGEYFLCPEMPDQSMRTVFRRSLYGSILISGVALTILSFDLMGPASEGDILYFGAIVMIVSVIFMPITVMQLYYAPWVIKDSGLFHLDLRDRSLSNVGDDLEDLLEFVAGIDIFLVWIELTINTELWVAPFVLFIVIGPLFSIMLNFTLIFMLIKDRVTLAVINLLITDYKVPDMVRASDHIRKRVISLVDRRMLVEEVVETEMPVQPSQEVAHVSLPELFKEYDRFRAESLGQKTRIRDARDELIKQDLEDSESVTSLAMTEKIDEETEEGESKSQSIELEDESENS